jgi:hypothetical protein
LRFAEEFFSIRLQKKKEKAVENLIARYMLRFNLPEESNMALTVLSASM